MSPDEIVNKKVESDKAAELLFNDSSKNVSDLKSRQWNATNLSVLAIMAIAVFAHDHKDFSPRLTTILMFSIMVCHLWVTFKCHTNLRTFRERIRRLISCYFAETSHALFEKGKKEWGPAREGEVPKGKEGQEFKDAVVDEGSIEFFLFATTPLTFLFACYIVWCLP